MGPQGVKARKIGAAAESSAFLLESIAGGRSNSSRNSSRFAALNDKAPERGHSSFRITSIGYDLQSRLHPFAEEIDGHIAALPALEILHMRVLREDPHDQLIGGGSDVIEVPTNSVATESEDGLPKSDLRSVTQNE